MRCNRCGSGVGSATETEKAIQKRLGNAKAEMDFGTAPGNFDAGSSAVRAHHACQDNAIGAS